MDRSKDHLEQRCPRLGGPVTFHYCRKSGDDGAACWKIFDCWWEFFDVVGYMHKCLPGEKFKALAEARPQPKIASLVELIAQARQRTADQDR
ncbi:MAG: hypothetical protein KKH68_13985 [Proteobacteria bacterium]|nr:hypothetical protein [Pseudomonadota bacterium]